MQKNLNGDNDKILNRIINIYLYGDAHDGRQIVIDLKKNTAQKFLTKAEFKTAIAKDTELQNFTGSELLIETIHKQLEIVKDGDDILYGHSSTSNYTNNSFQQDTYHNHTKKELRNLCSLYNDFRRLDSISYYYAFALFTTIPLVVSSVTAVLPTLIAVDKIIKEGEEVKFFKDKENLSAAAAELVKAARQPLAISQQSNNLQICNKAQNRIA